MEWFQAVVLGAIQGLTEFLPISSSAHLRIYPEVFGWGDPGAAFTAVTQIGTETAVILYFAKDIARIVNAWFRSLFSPGAARRQPERGSTDDMSTTASFEADSAFSAGVRKAVQDRETDGKGTAAVAADADDASPRRRRHRREPSWNPADARMGWFVIIGTIPIGVLGYLGKDIIEDDFRSLWVIGTTLVVLGIVLGIADKVGRRERSADSLRFRDAVMIGLAQALALIPGVSRSGASISMGLFLGLDRATAARFAFLLAIPAVLGAGIYEWPSAIDEGSRYGMAETILATGVAFVVGYAVIAWLMRWLSSHSYSPFVTYRITLGAVTLVLLATGNLAA